MVPKPNSTSQKQLRLSSELQWFDVHDRLACAIGYDDNEIDDVSMSYRFSKDPKQTRNSLEDDDDYQGVVETLHACRANSSPLQVIIFDDNVSALLPTTLYCSDTICFRPKSQRIQRQRNSPGKLPK